MQGLRTKNDQLRRVNARIDTLIEDIRSELLARVDTSLELSNGKIKSALRYIQNPLRNLSIDGDENMLHDKSYLYTRVIKELQGIIDRKEYSDGRELSESEIKSFEKARDLLKTEKEQGVDVISQVYKEVIDEKRGKNLENTFVRDKVEANSRVQEIRNNIQTIDQEFLEEFEPALKKNAYVLDRLQPQMGRFIKERAAITKLTKLDAEIVEINQKIINGTLSPEERAELKSKRDSLFSKQISIIKATNPEEYAKPNYARKSQKANGQKKVEPMNRYASRLRDSFSHSYEHDENILFTKINQVVDEKIGVLEVAPSTGKSTVKQVELKKKYFPNKVQGDFITPDEMAKFSEEFQKDLLEFDAAVREKKQEKARLEAEETDLLDVLSKDIRSASLAKVPYLETAEGQNLSAFAKWRQRMSFRFGNLSYLFKGRKAVEQAMVQKKIDEATLKINKKDLLRDVEEQQRQFKDKLQVKTKVKSNIFRKWEQEINTPQRPPQQRGSGR